MNSKINILLVKLIAFFTLIWFFAIPTIEMGISNASDAYHNKNIYKNNIGNRDKYKDLSIQDKYELLWDLIILEQAARKEEFKIEDIDKVHIGDIDLNAIKKSDIYKHIEAFSVLFLSDYKMRMMKPFYGEGSSTYYKENFEKIKLNLNKENIKKVKGVLKTESFLDASNVESEVRRDKYFFKFNSDALKIEVENKELIELIAVIGYETGRHDEILKRNYGFTFLISSILMFIIFVALMEQYILRPKAISKNIKEKYSTLSLFDYDGMLMLILLKGVLIVIVSAGFFNISLNLYLKEIGEIGEMEFWNLFFDPMNWLGYNVGSLYVNNVPLSRFVLFATMPIALSVYWFTISKRLKVAKLV